MGDRPLVARYEVLDKLASGGMGDVWAIPTGVSFSSDARIEVAPLRWTGWD
jgi:hypothetical protein